MTSDTPPDDRPTASAAATRAVRSATQVDRAAISVRAGLVAAIPVAAVLAVGAAAGQPVAAVTMGAGAMLSGVAWRGGGGPLVPPLGTMLAAVTGLAIATVMGTLTGHLPWLHLCVLAVFCLVGGLLTTLGRRGGVIGVQSVIAFVVFGRFPENVSGAFTLAGLALGGGAVQIAFATVVARPPAWRRQRSAVSRAYRELAALAADPGGSNIPSADALEEAELQLAGRALLADQAAVTLSSLVGEGRRIRIELVALGGFRDQPVVADRLELARQVLELIAVSIETRGSTDPKLDERARHVRNWGKPLPSEERAGWEPPPAVRTRLAALGGQLRAAARLTTQSARPPGLRHLAHPSRGARSPRHQLASDVRRLRASATLRSATGRHALRLAVAVTLTELVAQRADLPRGYWAVIAAATALRPEFGATFTRGAERLLGTTVGVIAATLIAVAAQPSGWGMVGVIGLLAWLTFSVFPASFAAGTAGITALIVFLLHPVAPDSTAIALDRGINTAVGGAIGVAIYLLWPTWSGRSAEPLLADVVQAQRVYLRAVLRAVIAGGRPDEAGLRRLARQARIAYSDAEAAVTQSEAEPVHGLDPRHGRAVLVALRRLVYSVHAIRADLMSQSEADPRPELAALAEAADRSLELIHGRLGMLPAGRRRLPGVRSPLAAEPPPAQLPPLRQLYSSLISGPGAASTAPVLAPMDELVDAIDTAGEALGLELP
jgi:uncharacterized membrane protein YgaE (UPF0421/DUF939 family)